MAGLPGPTGQPGAKGDKGDAGAAGATFRVVAPNAASASCDAGEVMISAYCTGSWTNYPLKPTESGASCGEAADVKVTIVCAKR